MNTILTPILDEKDFEIDGFIQLFNNYLQGQPIQTISFKPIIIQTVSHFMVELPPLLDFISKCTGKQITDYPEAFYIGNYWICIIYTYTSKSTTSKYSTTDSDWIQIDFPVNHYKFFKIKDNRIKDTNSKSFLEISGLEAPLLNIKYSRAYNLAYNFNTLMNLYEYGLNAGLPVETIYHSLNLCAQH